MNHESGFIFNSLFSLWGWFSIRVLFFSLLWLLHFFCEAECLMISSRQFKMYSLSGISDDSENVAILYDMSRWHACLSPLLPGSPKEMPQSAVANKMSHLNLTWWLCAIGDPKSWWEPYEHSINICLVSLKRRAARGTVCIYSKELKKKKKQP